MSMASLLVSGVDEVVVAHEDDRAGRVHVHFPRVGYQVKAAMRADAPLESTASKP